MEEIKIYRLNKRGNKITKRMEDGAPTYTIYDENNDPMCVLSFKGEHGKVITNSDLLEIVRDRLHYFNGTRFTNHSRKTAEDRLTEAIMWAERGSMMRSAFLDDDEKKVKEG